MFRLSRAIDCDVRILTEYMSTEAVAELRMATDIHVRLSSIDALSIAFSEHLAAENVVVAGSWLPYGPIRAGGIRYREVSHIGQLTELLADPRRFHAEHVQLTHGNRELVARFLDSDVLAQQWADAYTLLSQRKTAGRV